MTDLEQALADADRISRQNRSRDRQRVRALFLLIRVTDENAILICAIGESTRRRNRVQNRQAGRVRIRSRALHFAKDEERPIVGNFNADVGRANVSGECSLKLRGEFRQRQSRGMHLTDQRVRDRPCEPTMYWPVSSASLKTVIRS